jgi:hypothetical protein
MTLPPLLLAVRASWIYVLIFAHLLSLSPSLAANLRVTSGSCELSSGSCELKISASELSQADLRNATLPTITDLSAIDPKLSFEAETNKTSDVPAGTRTWVFAVKAAGTLSTPSQDRKIKVTWGAIVESTLRFALVAAQKAAETGSAIKWTVEPPATPWNLDQDRWTEFRVTRADEKLETIKLVHSTYMDTRPGRGTRLPLDGFCLCAKRDDDLTKCKDSAKLTGTTTTLWLTVAPGFREAGTFTGNLEIETDPRSDVKSLSVTINQEGPYSRAIGFSLILLGVTAAWLLLALGRGRLSRNQALLPAVLLRERVAGLVLALDSVPDPLKGITPETNLQLTQILGKLSESYLDAQQFLPPRVPSSFSTTTAQAAAYQTFLQAQSQLVDNLDAIIREGIQPASQKYSPAIAPGDLALLKTLIQNLDRLSATIPQPLSSLQTTITTLLANWHPSIAAQALGAAAFAINAPQPKNKTSFQILLQIEAVTIVFWIVWAILTTLAGFLVLILPNPGFGGAMDYVQCLLWGFGLPVAGQSLQQLSISSINTQLGITMPKS